jgi:hypothetical protein
MVINNGNLKKLVENLLQMPQCNSGMVINRENVKEIGNVRFEVSTAVTRMIIIFWEMTPCGS